MNTVKLTPHSSASTFFTLLVLVCLSLAGAQEVRGVLSFVDLDPTPPELFQDCLDYAPDDVGVLACTTGVEIVDEAKRVACLNNGGNECERYAFNIPMYPDKLGLTVEKVYQELWDRYVDDVEEYAKDKMKEAGCWAAAYPTTVLSQVIMYAHTEAAVRYWTEVFIASLYYMPAGLWWRSPFPNDGGVLVPSYSLIPKPQLYEELAANDDAYFFQPPAFPGSPVALDESDMVEGWPGLYSKEMLKQNFFNTKLTLPTALEYNQFGHASFFRAYGRRSMKVFVVFESSCLPPPPGKSPLGVFPVPFIPRADTEWLSVAEGYPFDGDDIAGDYWVPYPRGAFDPPADPRDAEALLGAFGGDLLGLLPLGGGLGGGLGTGLNGLRGGLGSFTNFSGFDSNTLEQYFNDLGDGYDDILTSFEFGEDTVDGLDNAGNLTDLDGLNAEQLPLDEGDDKNEPSELLTKLDTKLLETSPAELARRVVNDLPGGDFDALGFFEKIRTVAAFSSASEDYVKDQLTVTDAEGAINLDPARLGGIASNAGGLASFLGGSASGSAFGEQDFSYGGGGFLGVGGSGNREDLEEVLNCPALSVTPGERGPYPILGTASGGIVRPQAHYNDAIRYFFGGYGVASSYTPEMSQALEQFRGYFELPNQVVDTSSWVPSYTVLCDGDEGGEVRRLNSMLGGGGSKYDAERVAEFQAENLLEPDGVTGPETWLALSAKSSSGSLPDSVRASSASPLSLQGEATGPLKDSSSHPLLALDDPPPPSTPEQDDSAGEAASPEASEVSYENADEWPGTIRNWFGPDGPFVFSDPEGEASCRRYTVENPGSPFDYEPPLAPWELANIILATPNIILATENPANPDTSLAGEPDGSDPLSNVTAALANQPAKRSSGLASFGGETYLSPDMLEGLLVIADHYQIRVSAVAGGEHAPGSAHYGGGAFQIDMIDGETVLEIAERIETDTSVNVINKTYQEGDKLKNTCDWGSGESPIVQVLALCGAADAQATSGPTSDTIGRRDHIQCSWPTKADVR